MSYLMFYVHRVTRPETLFDPETLVGMSWEDGGGAVERRASEEEEARRELECQRDRECVWDREGERESESESECENDSDIDRENEDQGLHRALATRTTVISTGRTRIKGCTVVSLRVRVKLWSVRDG